VQDERRVGGYQQCLQFEDELRQVDVGRELAQLLRVACLPLEEVEPPSLLGGNSVVHRAAAGTNLGRGGDKEATAREDPVFDVREERVAGGEQAPNAARRGQAGADDVVDERDAGGLDGSELEVLFGVEVGIEAALAQAGGAGELADGQALETLDGGELGGGVQDGGASVLAMGGGLPSSMSSSSKVSSRPTRSARSSTSSPIRWSPSRVRLCAA
jgi:hypothetical protein